MRLARAPARERTPLTVVGGFLGAGKTTLLNRLLAETPGRIAVLVNDFGAVNVDAGLVAEHDGRTLRLTNGCVCCSLADGFLDTMMRVLAEPFDHVVVEASGVGDPWAIAEIALVEPALVLGTVIVLVDAERLPALLADARLGDTIRRQIAAADLLVLNKLDLAEDEGAGARAALRALCPALRVIGAVGADVPLGLILGEPTSSVPRRRLARAESTHEESFARLLYHRDASFDRERLGASLGRMPPSLLRLKGIVTLGGGERALLQMVGSRWDISVPPSGLAASAPIELVGIVLRPDADVARLEALLDAALAEVAAGAPACHLPAMTINPLLQSWDTPFGVPPFAAIEPAHFRPAIEAASAENLAEIAAIRDDPAPADFENTIAALERAGRALERVTGVFYNLTGAHTNEALQAVEREVSPIMARHWSAISLDPALFRRVGAVKAREAELSLDAEQKRVLDNHYRSFKRQGAGLPDTERQRLAAIAERLATLGTQFGQNVLADEQSFVLPLEGEADLAGLPDFLRASLRQAAEERGLTGHVVTLARSLIEPFLQYSTRRDLRERAFTAWTRRGENGGATDNRAIIAETVRLRAERARLLGFPSYAHFRLEETMAKTPEAAQGLLRAVWGPARALALAEQANLQEMADRDGAAIRIGPQDWRHYAERVRKERYDFDAAALKPYLVLDRMIEAAFDCASRLFGLTFEERHDLPVYHPAVRTFEVKNADGETIGLFLGDYYARPSKRSGAWMSAFRRQRKLDGVVRPIIVNVMNFAEGADGHPTLLSFDDARTLFHEFGHALHGMLSNVTYPSIAGTSVPRDWVEFPSQLFEHWLDETAVLSRFARHAETGEPMPPELIERLRAARKFNQGFATVEYVSSALVDLDFHLLPSADNLDVDAFEAASLRAIEMPDAITMRHRTPHFAHIFSGEGYASAYYSYMWSEVLDADGFAAFKEAGDAFDPATAKRLKDYVYAAGDLREPDEAYTLFRGRLPSPEALLDQRGLAPTRRQGEM